MKLFYRLLLISIIIVNPIMVKAREIIVITYTEENKTLEELKKQLKENFKIPDLIIKYKKIEGKCKDIEDVILQFCIEGHEVKQMTKNLEIVQRAFPAFLNDNFDEVKEMEISDEKADI